MTSRDDQNDTNIKYYKKNIDPKICLQLFMFIFITTYFIFMTNTFDQNDTNIKTIN